MIKTNLCLTLFLIASTAWTQPEAYPGLPQSAYHAIDIQHLKSQQGQLRMPILGARFDLPEQLNKSSNGNISFEQSNAFGHLNVTMGKNSLFGSWHHLGKDYRLTTDKSGIWLVELPGKHVITDSCGTAHHERPRLPSSGKSQLAATTIDVLVIHDQALALRYPDDLMQARIDHYVHVANQTFANSGLDLSVRLVGIKQVPYNHNNSNSDMLMHMQSTVSNSGTISGLENLPQWRQETGADLIIAIRPHDIETRGNCGLAFYPHPEFDNSYGMNMVSDGMSSWSLCSDQVFVHEIGHNLGAAHQYGAGGGTYQTQGSAFIKLFQFNTVMGSFGTARNNRSKRLPIFSNPNLLCGGQNCGLSGGAEPSNNAAVIQTTMQQVSSYLPAISSVPQPSNYNRSDRDFDGDGVNDWQDHFPFDAAETADADLDGTGDNADAFPSDAAEQSDHDNDGVGNNADNDDDGDGRLDFEDDFPLDATEQDDDDWDGAGNASDAFPNNPFEQLDFDQDGVGDHADEDDDGDGHTDLANDQLMDLLVINTGNNSILRFDAQTGRPMGTEVLPSDGLLTFQSDLSYDHTKNRLYFTSSSGVKVKNMMKRNGTNMLIPAYAEPPFDENKLFLGTGFPTGLFHQGDTAWVSLIDRGTLQTYNTRNPQHITAQQEYFLAPIETEESFIDIESGEQFYVLGLQGRMYRGNSTQGFEQLNPTGNPGLREAVDLQLTPSGDVLISDVQRKQILKYNANGEYQSILVNLRQLDLGSPTGMTLTNQGTLLVATLDNNIEQFDVDTGEYLGTLVAGMGLDQPHKIMAIPSLNDRFHHDDKKMFSPNAGMWFDPQSSGRGYDIGVFGHRLQMIWFTYDNEGLPIWYYTTNEVNGMQYNAPLYRMKKVGEDDPTFTEVGQVAVQFHNEREAVVEWQIGAESGTDHINWHFFNSEQPDTDYTGMWTRTDSPGWGFSITSQGDTTVVLSFLYDQAGDPRWVNSSNAIGPSPLGYDVGTFFNDSLCPGCVNGQWEEVVLSGNMTFDLGSEPYWSVDLQWPSPLSGQWLMNQVPLHRISEPPRRPR